jgi:hypothetical protein
MSTVEIVFRVVIYNKLAYKPKHFTCWRLAANATDRGGKLTYCIVVSPDRFWDSDSIFTSQVLHDMFIYTEVKRRSCPCA